jgi:hypothetical protein
METLSQQLQAVSEKYSQENFPSIPNDERNAVILERKQEIIREFGRSFAQQIGDVQSHNLDLAVHLTEGMNKVHRYTLQGFWRNMFNVIREYSKSGSDARNEHSVGMCKSLTRTIEGV